MSGRPELNDPEHDPKFHTIYLGRQVYRASYEQMRDDDGIRDAVEVVEEAVKANQLRYYVPPSQSVVDFLNDAENDVKLMVAPNGVGKTCAALIDVVLDCIPNDPEWELFKVEGVKPRVWMGPKRVAICTYKMQLHKRHIWPEIQKWIPHDQLGAYRPGSRGDETRGRGLKEPSWDRDPHIRLKCGTRIYFMAYEQDQDVFESFACDLFLWDEQGVEAKFDGADERVRRRSGRHVFSLTPHKVDGRPDTGHGSWIHKMVTGQNTKGHSVAVYTMSIEDALERYYPAKKKGEAYEKWIEIPTRNNDVKTLREGKSRYYGEWHTTSGLVLDEVVPDIHFIDPFVIDGGYTLYRGVDHGTRNPTACLWAAVDREGFIYVYREYYSTGKTIGQNVRNIVEMSGNVLERLEVPGGDDDFVGMELPRFAEVQGKEVYAKTVLDSRSFSTMDAQSGRPTGWVYRALGLMCQKASGKHDEFRIPLVKELLRVNNDLVNPITGAQGSPRMFFFNTLTNFQREWQGYVWEEFASKADQKNAKEHGRQKENHLMTCFVGDTPVLTMEGDVPISDVRAGDYVATRSGFRRVVASGLTRRCARVVRALFSDGREIVCTPDHRFYVPREDRFLPLTDIPYLTQVYTADSLQPSPSTSIKKQEPVHLVALRDGGIADVYDIQVESDHEFFANGILVHNCLFYLAQIPMRYLGAYGEGKVLTGERVADKSAGAGERVRSSRISSSVTGY